MPNKPGDQPSSEKSWYYLVDDETLGPVPGAQLRRLLQSGDLGPDTLVWRQGMKDWVPARALLAGAAQRPPVPPTGPPVRAAGPGQVAERAHPAVRTGSEEPSHRKPRGSTRRVTWVVVGVLAAMAMLMCGVGIGLLLRKPPAQNGGEAQATPAQTGDPRAQVAQRAPAARREPPPAADARQTQSTSASRDPATGASDATSVPSGNPSPLPDEPIRSAADDPGPSAAPGSPASLPDRATDPAPASGTMTLYQVIDVYRRPSYGIEGIMMAQEMRYQILTRMTMGTRQPDKTRPVTQTIEQVRLGAADEMSRATYETALNKLVGQQYKFTLNELDEITDFTGFQSTTTNVPIERPQEAGLLLATVLDQDGWKELTQRSFLRPPPGAATGQVWRGPLHHSWGPLGTWRGVTTYTPRGPEGYGVRYDFAHEMSYVPPEPSSGVLPFDVAGAEFQPVQASGSFVFDAQHGHVISVREVFHVRGAVAAGLLGSTARVQIEEYQEFAVQITKQNPWQP